MECGGECQRIERMFPSMPPTSGYMDGARDEGANKLAMALRRDKLISPLFIHHMQQRQAINVPPDVFAEQVQRTLHGWVRVA